MSVPERIGRYRILSRLGQGGMGVVYRARDDQLGRLVAVKMIAEDMDDEESRKRLRREAQAAARVHHPNVCEIYDFGQVGESLYIVMELLEGEALDTRIGRGPLPVSEAIRLATEILTALEVLHAEGLVHRDLKPSNFFLTAQGVKLLDFGLAKGVVKGLGELQDRTMTQLTRAGIVVGTPRYMAPEQVRGEPVDHRADLFALGAVLFEVLTGTHAFRGNSPFEIWLATLNEEPLALGGSLVATVLDRVVRRSLRKRAEDRYQSAAEMKRELLAALPPDDVGQAVRACAMARLMILPFRVLRPDPDTDFLAFSVPDAIAIALSSLPSVVVRSPVAGSRFVGEKLDLKQIAEVAEVDVVLTGTLLRAGAQIRVSAQLLEVPAGRTLWSHTPQMPMKDVFRLQDEIVERIVGSLSLSLTAREHRNLKQDVPASPTAYELYLRANHLLLEGLRGGEHLEIARDLYQRCIEEDRRYAPAWARLGRTHWLIAKGTGRPSGMVEADACFRRALELNPELALAHNLFSYVETERGHAREAMVRLLQRAAVGASQPELYGALCHVCRFAGQLEASVAAHEQARRLDPQISTSVSQTYWQLGDLESAMRCQGRGMVYLDSFLLVEMGHTEKAIAQLREKEAGLLLDTTRHFIAAFRAVLEGKRQEALEQTESAMAGMPYPEERFWLAAQLARLGETDRALETLRESMVGGFVSYRALDRHPWLVSLRTEPAFTGLRELARQHYNEAVQAFVAANGEQVLGVAVRGEAGAQS